MGHIFFWSAQATNANLLRVKPILINGPILKRRLTGEKLIFGPSFSNCFPFKTMLIIGSTAARLSLLLQFPNLFSINALLISRELLIVMHSSSESYLIRAKMVSSPSLIWVDKLIEKLIWFGFVKTIVASFREITLMTWRPPGVSMASRSSPHLIFPKCWPVTHVPSGSSNSIFVFHLAELINDDNTYQIPIKEKRRHPNQKPIIKIIS